MNSPEHAEFVALFKSSGWSQGELARQLYTTQATVSRYLSGVVPVHASAVRLLKLTLASENPDALQSASPRQPLQKTEVGTLRDQLDELKQSDPQAFKTAKHVIDSLHAQATAKPLQPPLAPVKPASGERRNDPAFLKKLATAHPLRAEVSVREPRAASPIGNKPALRPRTSPRPSTPPSPPAPVPAGRES